jgi:HK97 family phage prohead protease
MKYAVRSAPPPSGDALEFVLSDNSVDRVGDVIEQNWELAHFRKNPIALFNHDRDQVIGRWESVRIDGDRLLGKLQLAAEGTSELVNTVRKLLAQKILRAVSVGFTPIKHEKLNEESDDYFGPFRFLKSELLEASLVAVPANPHAVQLARSMNLSPTVAAVVFRKPAHEPTAAPKAIHGKPAEPPAQQGAKMSLSQRIEQTRATLVARRDQLKVLSDRDDLNADEQLEFQSLPSEIEQDEKTLGNLESAEKTLARANGGGNSSAAANGGAASDPAQSQQQLLPSRRITVPKKLEPIDYFFRAATCFALAKANRAPDPLEFLRERYRNDEVTGLALSVMTRAAPGPALTTQATWAAELIQTGFADFLSTLKPFAIYSVIAPRGPKFTFGPSAGVIKIPARSATPNVAGAFVGEAQPIPVKKLGLTTITLMPYKMAVITMFSEEIQNRSTPQIETMLRQEMTEDTSVAIDTALISANAAVAGVSPAGLRNGVSGLTPTATGTNTEKMVADIKQLLVAITANNGGRDIVIMLNPSQALSLKLAQTTTGAFMFDGVGQAGAKFDVTFVASNTVTAGMLIAVDAADFASATGDTPRFRLSAEATVHDEDTTPLPISTTGAPNVVAAPVRSFFQTDVMGIRMIWDMSWQMRRAGMVAWMTGVTW